MRRALVLAAILIIGCNDSSKAPPILAQDLSAAIDAAPKPCGTLAPCSADQVCVLIALRPSTTGCGADAGACTSAQCVAVPPACDTQRNCSCLNGAKNGNFCSPQLGPSLMCGDPGVQAADIICAST